jgi:5'-nucleotidase
MPMKLLLINDDGIDAPGLEALFQAAVQLGDPVVVAPEGALSGCSHQVTTHQPLRVREVAAGRVALGGTPADCVRIGLQHIAPDAGWVLSGINAGGNLGADVYHSGTVAAAREAVLHGWPAVALSHYHKRGVPIDWPRATAWAVPLLRELLARPLPRGSFWNINLPHLAPDRTDPEAVHCRLDPSPLPLSYRKADEGWHYDGDYHQRRREPGTDVDVCFRGQVAVTRIALF